MITGPASATDRTFSKCREQGPDVVFIKGAVRQQRAKEISRLRDGAGWRMASMSALFGYPLRRKATIVSSSPNSSRP